MWTFIFSNDPASLILLSLSLLSTQEQELHHAVYSDHVFVCVIRRAGIDEVETDVVEIEAKLDKVCMNQDCVFPPCIQNPDHKNKASR